MTAQKILKRLPLLVTFYLSFCISHALAESGGAIGPEQNQVSYTREYLASQRLFDRMVDTSSNPPNESNIQQLILSHAKVAERELNKAMREYPFYNAVSYSISTVIVALPILASWRTLQNAFFRLPEIVQILSTSLIPPCTMLALIPIASISLQAYFAVAPPALAEENLVIQYGSKKNFLAPSTQSYIENELFYSYWQNPSAYGLTRLRKILDKALRLPVYTKRLTYSRKRISEALVNFPQEVVDRLSRYAMTEIMFQRMDPKPSSHYPVYFQGAPGTGKTYAAQKLTEAMGTTLAVVTLEGASIDDMIGTSFESQDARAGRLLDAILANTNSSADINHKNQVLIIDEFDRLLISNDKKSEEVLAFMLKLLDPVCRSFYSAYLKTEVQLPDSIILAGNTDINLLALKEPRLVALASRLETVHFPGFSPEAKQQIVERIMIPRLEKSYRSLGKGLSDFALPDEDRSKIVAFTHSNEDPGLRNLEKYINSLFEQHLIHVIEPD
ncbi:AAA family ATPase [Sansalvadorimonas sp. 2012CJ34-2]|uniref:AAA family ATPase n=1 Tax=Parendozoicomonas callyspongiae TaxID=2942213 RepID=A0ABT0PKU4_9GAMM|nr:AAA family ATPase [Sansalvadorimonas sp. 2012CJ34-2]MCL6272005.1 AAA family ATPase [Sansalvadorimonas sp. 2012CJ34-2]